jgi:hypothetical protein
VCERAASPRKVNKIERIYARMVSSEVRRKPSATEPRRRHASRRLTESSLLRAPLYVVQCREQSDPGHRGPDGSARDAEEQGGHRRGARADNHPSGEHHASPTPLLDARRDTRGARGAEPVVQCSQDDGADEAAEVADAVDDGDGDVTIVLDCGMVQRPERPVGDARHDLSQDRRGT